MERRGCTAPGKDRPSSLRSVSTPSPSVVVGLSTVDSASRPATISLATALLLTAVSGVLYGVAFPPLALRPLAWIALVPWLVAIRRGSLARALLLGALWSCVETDITSDCLPGAVANYYKQSPAIGWLMLLGATVTTMVPYYSSFAACYWALARRYRAALPLLTAAAWCGAELARVKVLGGNPWAVSGYSQVGFLPLMQVADLAGVHGISFILAAVNAGLAELWLARCDPRTPASHAGPALASAAAVLLLALTYGTLRLRSSNVESALGPPTRVAIIQGNLDLGAQWRQDMYGRNLDTYLRMTYAAAQESDPALVFWPESAMTFFLRDEPMYRSAIGRVLTPLGVELMAGGPRVEGQERAGQPSYFNSTFLVSPRGEIVAWQDKTKLLPFAEYFPLQGIDLLRRDFGRARQFTPGEPRPPLPSVAGRAGVVVCNEAMFPEPVSERVAAGAEFLVNPANDSWFGSLKYSLQAFDIVRLRAIEQHRYIVRTSTAGPSAIIDPMGRVLVASGAFTREWISGSIRPSHVSTVYQRLGDLFAWACGIVAVVSGLATLRRAA